MKRFKDITATSIDDQLCFDCNEKRRSSKMEELLYIYAMYKSSGATESEFILYPRQGSRISQVNLLFNLCVLSYKDDLSPGLFEVFSSWHCESKHKLMSWCNDGPFVPANIRCYCCFWDKEDFKVHPQDNEKIFPYDYTHELIKEIQLSDMLYPYVEMIDKSYETYVNLGLEGYYHYKDFQLPEHLFSEHMLRIDREACINGELRFAH